MERRSAGSRARNSYFVFVFLKGLDLKRGQATVRDLYSFLRPKVQDAARSDNREQTPQLQAAGDASVPLR